MQADIPDFDKYIKSVGSAPKIDKPKTGSALSDGANTALGQFPQLAYGVEAGIGAFGEKLFG